jgi:hypothetical protein
VWEGGITQERSVHNKRAGGPDLKRDLIKLRVPPVPGPLRRRGPGRSQTQPHVQTTLNRLTPPTAHRLVKRTFPPALHPKHLNPVSNCGAFIPFGAQY